MLGAGSGDLLWAATVILCTGRKERKVRATWKHMLVVRRVIVLERKRSITFVLSSSAPLNMVSIARYQTVTWAMTAFLSRCSGTSLRFPLATSLMTSLARSSWPEPMSQRGDSGTSHQRPRRERRGR